MRAINLYTISRKIHRELRPLYENALSGRVKETKVREEEIDINLLHLHHHNIYQIALIIILDLSTHIKL